MSRYRFTARASRDLDEIYEFIARDRPQAAAGVLDLIERKCEALVRFPEMGASREELAPRLRSFPVGKYVIFYRPAKDGIEVIRILHGARDIPSIFEV